MFTYSVIQLQPLAEHISQIILEPKNVSASLSYEAGQYIEVLHADQHASPLSIACAPNTNQRLEFHLYHPHDNLNAQNLLQMAQQQKEWHIRGPYGRCTTARLEKNKPIIFLAYGTAFAPVKAVIEGLLQTKDYPPMHIFWSGTRRSDIYMTHLLETWVNEVPDFMFTPVFIRDMSVPVALHELVLRDYTDLQSSQVYAAGPGHIIAKEFAALSAHGLVRERFYSDVL